MGGNLSLNKREWMQDKKCLGISCQTVIRKEKKRVKKEGCCWRTQ